MSLIPGTVLELALASLCFTSSEREYDGGRWDLPAFGDYMISGCPEPPDDLWPNATVGQLHWGDAV